MKPLATSLISNFGLRVSSFFTAPLLLLAAWLPSAPAFGQSTNLPACLPTFRYYGVVLRAQDLKYRPHNDVIYPSVVRTESPLPHPLGKFYLYYAPHDVPGGICVAYADRPEGPWHEFTNNPVITQDWPPYYKVSHVSGPDSIWSEEEHKVFCYYHGENGTTRLATSTNGLQFTYEDAVVDATMFHQVSEASYGRVFRYTLPGQDNRYIMLLLGNNRGTRKIYLATSPDGHKWFPRPDPFLEPPPGTDQAAGAIYLPLAGRHFILLHANNSKPAFNEGFDLYLAETDAAFQHAKHLGKFMDRYFVSPDNVAVMSPSLLEDQGRLYLFFNIGPRLQNQIALAIGNKN